MEKYFDAKDMKNVIDDIEWVFSGYREHSDGLISCYEKYRDNELFQGELAEASKQFIDKRQITQAKAQVAMQQKLLGMYKHALSSFHEKVDKAPDARVDLETLDMVNRDLQEIYADLDEYVRYIEKVVKLLQARYGFLGIFTMPNFQPALDTFTALCGGDNLRSGFIYDLKQKFINFDADECAYADSLNFEQEIDDANDKIQAATNLLEGYVTPNTKSQTTPVKSAAAVAGASVGNEVNEMIREKIQIKKMQREQEEQNIDPAKIMKDTFIKYYQNNKETVETMQDYNNGKFDNELETIKEIYEKNKETYQAISDATGVPPELICAIHYRESGCDFDTYLHNGQKLGQPTTIVPKDVFFTDFKEAAIDALKSKVDSTGITFQGNYDMATCMTFAEAFNGFGYANNGHVNPYLYSGTGVYQVGKYSSDGHYDPNLVDQQPGVFIIVDYLNDGEKNGK